MKNLKGTNKLLCVFIISITFHCSIVKAQQTLTTINGWNAYVHLPNDYTSTTIKYPVIIFIAGVGEVGTTASKMLTYGPSKFISQGDSMNFWVNGVLEKPIVISIQPPTAWPIANSINTEVDSIVKRWRVNTDRLYLTGLSMGAWSFDNYITATQPYANKPAALVVMSAPESNYPLENYAWYAQDGGRWWGFEGTSDYRKMDMVRDMLNSIVPGSARYTQYVGGHCCWNTWYDPRWTENGESIYTWMLKQTKAVSSTPPNILPVANAGSNVSITLPQNSTPLSGSATDADGTIASYQWTKISGPALYTIANPTAAQTTVSGLIPGQYGFELKVTDNAGGIGRDTVYVLLNAAQSSSSCNTAPSKVYTLVANAGEIYIPNASTKGWKGGDTLRVAAGNYSLIDLGNFKGDSCRPIVIINYGGQVTVDHIRFGNDASYFKLTGTGSASYTYGFKINSAFNAGVAITTGHHIEVCNIEVTGTEVGFYFKKNPDTTDPLSNYPNYVLSNYYIHHNYIHDVHGEGMYIGHTYPSADPYSGNLIPIRMDQIEIAYNIVDGTDWDGIQLSNARSGAKIHHNTVTNFGRINMGSQQAGIILGGNTNGDIYDNVIKNGTGNGIEAFGYGLIKIYNNEVESTGADGTASGQESVYCNDPLNLVEVNPVQQIQFYNNIIRYPKPKGAVRVAAYLNNSGPAQLTSNQYCIPSAPANWLSTYVVANPFASVVNNNILMTNCATPNQPPVANAGSSITIALPVNATTLSGSGTDADGSIVSYQWAKIGGPAQFNIVTPAAASTAINNLVQGQYIFELIVTDNTGLSGRDTVTVTVTATAPPPNQAPIADAGVNISITLPTNTVTLNGTGTDADGSITSYQWTKISGPAQFTIVSTSTGSTPVNGLVQGLYWFQLTVTDNGGLTAKDTVAVTVNAAPNQRPVANAGPDQTITLPLNTVSLNGTGTDADGSIVSYLWTKISGPSQFTLSSPAAASTLLSNLTQGQYTLELTVTDNGGLSSKDTVSVTVNAAPPPPPPDNLLPTANAGVDYTITLPVNNVTVNGSGTDADGSITGYQWTKISGPAQYTVVSANAASTSITNLLEGQYLFELLVVDNAGAVAKDTVLITVNPAPNQPPIANAGPDVSITLPLNTTTLLGSGIDPDGSIVSYLWTKISGPSQFSIQSPTSPLSPIDNLVQGQYLFELLVTDNGGLTSKDTVLVTVNPNQAPIANAGNDINITLPTNTVTVTGTGTDADGSIASYQWTKISGPAQFTLVSASTASTVINGLVEGQYIFQLTVTDNGGLTSTDAVTITVNPAPPPPPNQPPVANAGSDINITLPTNNVTLNGTGSDPDGSIVSYQWTKISGPAQFTIVSANAASTDVNNLVQGQYQFQLTVTDNGGMTATANVTVTVNATPPPPPNQPPVANAGVDLNITLPTNSVTLNGSGTDADGTIASYQWTKISGPAQFTIVSANAASTIINGLIQGQYLFVLTVTDNGGLTAKDTVSVIVNAAPPPPANIPPVANAGVDYTLTLPLNTVTLTGSGTDADGSIVSHQWTKISGPAQIILSNPTSTITGVSDLVEGVYQIEFAVTDNGGLTGRDTVTITVVKPTVVTRQGFLDLSVYPNPAVNTINARMVFDKSGQDFTLAIFNIAGERTYESPKMSTNQTGMDYAINIASMLAGTYVLELKFEDGTKLAKKFIKQ